MRFGIARLEARGLAKFDLRPGASPPCMSASPRLLCASAKPDFASRHREHIGGAGGVVILAEDQPNCIRASVYLGSRLMASFSSPAASPGRPDCDSAKPKL